MITMGPQPIYQSIDSAVVLDCIAEGNPQPNIQWFRDKAVLVGENTAHYYIKRLDLETRGQYFCTATNKLGYDKSEEIYVKIKGLLEKFFSVHFFHSGLACLLNYNDFHYTYTGNKVAMSLGI